MDPEVMRLRERKTLTGKERVGVGIGGKQQDDKGAWTQGVQCTVGDELLRTKC